MERLLVLDFDGTMTDAEAEGVPFHEGYLEDIGVLTGLAMDEVRALATRFAAEVAADPDTHGWVFDGRIVAPASVDPYLRIMPIARKIFDHVGAFLRDADRTRLLDLLYKDNYPKTKVAFRPGAREALIGLEALEGVRSVVVSNSPAETLQRKIRALGANPDGSNALEPIIAGVNGHAMKYVIDDAFTAVPASIALPGLARPVLLRRRHYFNVLDRLRRECGATWADVTVVGDIFELDLSLPLALGARVGLVVNAFTPAYEKAFVSTHPRGRLLGALAEIEAFVTTRNVAA